MNKMIAYLRVSTDKQADTRNGLEAQRATIAAYATSQGLEIVEWAEEIDSAVSGDRPVRYRALEAIASGEADGIIAATQSRISRSVIETSALLDWAERKKVRVIMCDANVDTATAAGRMVAQILAAVAENEAAQISERTRKGLEAKKARGEAISRPTVNEEVRELIEALRAEGSSLQVIADTLNERGIPTARGGKEWRKSSVHGACGYERPRKRVIASLPN